jgi:hypothetical protein
MNARYTRLLMVFMLCMGLWSCAVRRVDFNTPITPEDLSFIRAGETTLHHVVHHLGAPEEITAVSDLLLAEFKWSTTRSSSLNLGYLFRAVSPVAPTMTLSGTGINIQRLLIICDDRLIVRSYAFGLTDEHAFFEFWPF